MAAHRGEIRAEGRRIRLFINGTQTVDYTEPDTTMRKTAYVVYHRPLAARAYYLLGDYQTTLDLLSTFEPDVSASRGRQTCLARQRLQP